MLDPSQVARDWDERGFGCELWTDQPGARWEDFTHPADELVFILEGDVEFELEGVVYRPRPGEELLIPAGVRHSARNVGSTTSRWLYGYKRG